MTRERKHNLIWLPFVIFVRVPLLLPFMLAHKVGEIGLWLDGRLPGLLPEPRRPQRRPSPQDREEQ